MTQNLMLKNGKWINAIEEPYYPNIFEKIKHFFGIHIYPDFYRGQSKCLICGNIKLILGNSYYYSKDKNKWESFYF